MADAENATRAPESDAQEPLASPHQPAASDNVHAQEEPTATGEHCVTDRPTRMLFSYHLSFFMSELDL